MEHQYPYAAPVEATSTSSPAESSSSSSSTSEFQLLRQRLAAISSRNSASGAPSSLDILKPEPWVPLPDSDKKPSPDAALLESLSTQLIVCFCTQDWTNPLLELATPNFSAYIDHVEARVRSFDEHVAFHQWLHLTHPDYKYEVENVSADVDDEKGVASVWALLSVRGYPAHIRRESLTVFWWRRRKGKWRCYKQLGIRGVNWFDS